MVPSFLPRYFASARFGSRASAVLMALALISGPSCRANLGFDERSDGGPGAYTTGNIADAELSPANLTGRFPLVQRSRIQLQGGGVRGFGMLAEYGASGPGEIAVIRETTKGDNEPYAPITLAKVFDPDGNVAAVENFTNQLTGREVRILKINTKKAGIWRVSFSGGRSGDMVELRLPRTDIWGVRGEMILAAGTTMPRPGYLWIPPTAVRLMVGIENGSADGMKIQDSLGRETLGSIEPDRAGRLGRIVLDQLQGESVVTLKIPAGFDGGLVIDGAPGLLCPTEQAARRLRGGVVESHGFYTQGPLQARARDWMIKTIDRLDRNPRFEFTAYSSAKVPRPELDVLMFGKYGFANNLDALVSTQNAHLDPKDPFIGSFKSYSRNQDGPNWTNFQMPTANANFETAALASAFNFPSALNPAKGREDLMLRATLGAFSTFMSMQGDNIIRENSMETSRYPMIHSFFIYPPALAQTYRGLRDELDPEAREIWREGLLAVGYKLADYQGYQSNQWSHMILGHLETYIATGEKRFLDYFESMAAAFFDNTYGDNGKFGQHSAGFFLEEFGPDGNYDHLSAYNLVAAWNDYRVLKEAKPELVKKMTDGIGRNIAFSSLFWLPDPSGDVDSPTSFNCRTTAGISGLGYPGMIMAKSDFPLGLTRFNMTPEPPRGLGMAGTFSYVANTKSWMIDTIEDGLNRGPSGFNATNGVWVPHIYNAYSKPQKVKAAKAPVQDIGGTWELPGLFAWNRSGLYGVVFADVAGSKRELNGFFGGGPTALWTAETGTFVRGVAPDKPGRDSVAKAAKSKQLPLAGALTFSCVYGTDANGDFFHSGKERADVNVVAKDSRYSVKSRLDAVDGDLEWLYELSTPNTLKFAVALKSGRSPKEIFLNLPLYSTNTTRMRLESPNSLVVEQEKGSSMQARVRISWPSTSPGKLEKSVNGDIERLVVPLPADGKYLTVNVEYLK